MKEYRAGLIVLKGFKILSHFWKTVGLRLCLPCMMNFLRSATFCFASGHSGLEEIRKSQSAVSVHARDTFADLGVLRMYI